MRIVNLEQFRAMPPWTVFRKYRPCVADDLAFKFDTLDSDFVSMTVDMPQSDGSDQLFDRLHEMLRTGKSYMLDVDCAGRDGLFDHDQLFMVYELGDLVALRILIEEAVETARKQSGP